MINADNGLEPSLEYGCRATHSQSGVAQDHQDDEVELVQVRKYPQHRRYMSAVRQLKLVPRFKLMESVLDCPFFLLHHLVTRAWQMLGLYLLARPLQGLCFQLMPEG